MLTLGLGIGITTTTFAVAYGVLLRPLPLPKEDRLVSLRHIRLTNDRDGGAGTAPWAFARYRDASRHRR